MVERHRILIGSLGAGMPTGAGTTRLSLGPDHPSQAGILELHLTSSAGRIVSADPVVGAMHRGVEKLFEVRDYRQILMLANRHDWQAPFFGELAAARLIEQQMGLPVPARAAAIRVLLAEHARVSSHLGQLTWLAARAGTSLREQRARLRESLVELSGNRVHPMVTRLGGLAVDPEPSALAALSSALTAAADRVATLPIPDDLHDLVPVPAELIAPWGLSGPLVRATGRAVDLRHEDPGYAQVADLLRVHADAGDAAARFTQLIGEVGDSAQLVARLLPQLPDGEIGTKLPKIVKIPEGSGHLLVEGAFGRTGFRIVSRGQKTPWRMKLRSASFQHLSALQVLLPGVGVDQVEAALASIGWVIGDVDK